MRQHVNPLSSFFQLPLELPLINKLFDNGDLPIHLDIGCAKGEFIINLASIDPNYNYLGVEIRPSLVVSAQKRKNDLSLNNVSFLYCNANISLKNWLGSLGQCRLERVSINFPDPWFKRRHHKRRVLKPELLISIANAFHPESKLFIQSDVFEVIEDMSLLIDLSNCFNRYKGKSNSFFLPESPFPALTEREKYIAKKNLPVYRLLYNRNMEEAPTTKDLENKYGIFKCSKDLS